MDAPAALRVFDAAQLRETEIAAFRDDLAAQVRAVHAHGVVGAVADLRVRLAARLHVSADAAVIEQIDRRQQDRAYQLVRRERRGADAERGLYGGRKWNRLRRARKHAAARRNQRRIVVGPARTLEREQTAA